MKTLNGSYNPCKCNLFSRLEIMLCLAGIYLSVVNFSLGPHKHSCHHQQVDSTIPRLNSFMITGWDASARVRRLSGFLSGHHLKRPNKRWNGFSSITYFNHYQKTRRVYLVWPRKGKALLSRILCKEYLITSRGGRLDHDEYLPGQAAPQRNEHRTIFELWCSPFCLWSDRGGH